ncbi:hypothetical protein SAMN04515660_0454 [Luteibacter sp. 329MFSha]|nr:hypothetical protein SAMN04515660_0454 [Luteibacter sp. 329MFSha]
MPGSNTAPDSVTEDAECALWQPIRGRRGQLFRKLLCFWTTASWGGCGAVWGDLAGMFDGSCCITSPALRARRSRGFTRGVPAARDRRCDRLPPFRRGMPARLPAARDRRCDRLPPFRRGMPRDCPLRGVADAIGSYRSVGRCPRDCPLRGVADAIGSYRSVGGCPRDCPLRGVADAIGSYRSVGRCPRDCPLRGVADAIGSHPFGRWGVARVIGSYRSVGGCSSAIPRDGALVTAPGRSPCGGGGGV